MCKRKKVLNLHPQYTTSIAVLFRNENAKIAQLVERDLAKVEVAGSSPVFRSASHNAWVVFDFIDFLKVSQRKHRKVMLGW